MKLNNLHPNVQGALWILLAGVFMTVMATTVKFVGQSLDSFVIAFFRAAFGLIIILPFVWRGGREALRIKRPWLHLARGVLAAGAMMCGFYAITHLPLADAVAIGFARPLFILVFAVIFLSEIVHRRRWSATLVGFVGVLIMVRPHGAMDPAALVALAGAFTFAAVTIILKKLSAEDRPATLMLSASVIVSILSFGPAIAHWRTPTLSEFGLLLFMSAVGTVAQSCRIRGLTLGEASAIAPFDYVRLIFAASVGFLIFGEMPDWQTGLGALVIAASTFYIAHREAGMGKTPATPVPGAMAINPDMAPNEGEERKP